MFFYSGEGLKSVTICENAMSDKEIKIGDQAFQYCKRLETVNIGNGLWEDFCPAGAQRRSLMKSRSMKKRLKKAQGFSLLFDE